MINGTVDNVSYVQRNDGALIYVYEHGKVPATFTQQKDYLIVARHNIPFRVKHAMFNTSYCYVKDENGFVLPAEHEEVSNALSRGLDSDGFFKSKFIWIKAERLTLVEENSKKHLAAITIQQEKQRLKKMKKIPALTLEPSSFYLLKNGNCIFFFNKFRRKSNQEIVYFSMDIRIPSKRKHRGINVINDYIREHYLHNRSTFYIRDEVEITNVIEKLDLKSKFQPRSIYYYFDDGSRPRGQWGRLWKDVSEIENDYDTIA